METVTISFPRCAPVSHGKPRHISSLVVSPLFLVGKALVTWLWHCIWDCHGPSAHCPLNIVETSSEAARISFIVRDEGNVREAGEEFERKTHLGGGRPTCHEDACGPVGHLARSGRRLDLREGPNSILWSYSTASGWGAEWLMTHGIYLFYFYCIVLCCPLTKSGIFVFICYPSVVDLPCCAYFCCAT